MSPRKRQKLDIDALEVALPDIIKELDLEICFRERLAKTIESRITWALILQESLQSDQNGSTTSFKDVAIDTFSTIEAHTEFLFERPPTQIYQQPTHRPSRPPPKPKPPTRNPNTTFLYIRSADLELPHDENHIQTYLLRCPTCFRTTFTSLQGLLNHARISHSQDWGSHDECVRACAVADPGIDVDAGIEVGLGPVGILPGLRSLFQRAVGAHTANGSFSEAGNTAEIQPPQEPTSGLHLARTLGLHKDTPALAPFLGKQAIRRGIKEWDDGGVVDIDGFEEDNSWTTNGRERNSIKGSKPKRWRMPYMHRNDAESSIMDSHIVDAGDQFHSAIVQGDEQKTSNNIHSSPGETHVIDRNIEEERISKVGPTDAAIVPGIRLGTRFHFVARIVITDCSLWIPLDRRQKNKIDNTHMWMLSVDSPSYSHHITTILQRMTVTSLTDPGKFPALTKSDPPFAVFGTTNEPFLAKVEMCFSSAPDADGQMSSQTIVLEHWVELDLVKFTTPAVGEEQVVDIELDKATILMPVRTGYTPIDAKVLWNLNNSHQERTGSIDGNKSKDGAQAEPTEGYAKILTSLLGRFPMTLKDTLRGRPPNPPLPYKLVSTPAQLKNLVLGRRKAIEWGRARAVRDAYTQIIQEQHTTAEDAIPLTTADVFNWLSEEGHFLKRPTTTPTPTKGPADNRTEDKSIELWCHICGQGVDAHLMVAAVKKEAADPGVKARTIGDETKDGDIHARALPYPCNIVPTDPHITQMPVVDVQALLGRYPTHHYSMAATKTDDGSTKVGAVHRFGTAQLVAGCDPHISLGIEKVIARLKLPAFTYASMEHSGSQSRLQYPLDMMGKDKAGVETQLAPYAILGLATKQFVRVLIEGGLEIAKREKDIVGGLKRRRKVGKEKDGGVSMLTPTHIMKSVVSGRREVDVAIFGTLARLRVHAHPHAPVQAEQI